MAWWVILRFFDFKQNGCFGGYNAYLEGMWHGNAMDHFNPNFEVVLSSLQNPEDEEQKGKALTALDHLRKKCNQGNPFRAEYTCALARPFLAAYSTVHSSHPRTDIFEYYESMMRNIRIAEQKLKQEEAEGRQELIETLDPDSDTDTEHDTDYDQKEQRLNIFKDVMGEMYTALCQMENPIEVPNVLKLLTNANFIAERYIDPNTATEIAQRVLLNLETNPTKSIYHKFMAIWFVLNFLCFKKLGIAGHEYVPPANMVFSLGPVWNYIRHPTEQGTKAEALNVIYSVWNMFTDENLTSEMLKQLGMPLFGMISDLEKSVPIQTVQEIKSLYQDELNLIGVPTMAPIPDSPATSKRSAGDQACPKEAKASRLSS